jgi:hypothetical protein
LQKGLDPADNPLSSLGSFGATEGPSSHGRLDHMGGLCQKSGMDSRDAARKPAERGELAAGKPKSIVPERELPVVARLMVEIRSDGSYTVARGAMEDAVSGQKVAIEASGANPLALALSLAKTLTDVPWLARQAFRALMRSK